MLGPSWSIDKNKMQWKQASWADHGMQLYMKRLLWNFPVNKQQVRLHSLIISKTHCVCCCLKPSWNKTLSPCFSKQGKHFGVNLAVNVKYSVLPCVSEQTLQLLKNMKSLVFCLQTFGKVKGVSPEAPLTTRPTFKSSICSPDAKQIQGLGTGRYRFQEYCTESLFMEIMSSCCALFSCKGLMAPDWRILNLGNPTTNGYEKTSNSHKSCGKKSK